MSHSEALTPSATPGLTFRYHWAARTRSWVSILLLVPAGVLALGSPPLLTRDGWWDLALQTTGWLLFMAGASLRWWATLYIGGRKTTQLATGGPYSICRNPLYVGTFLLLFSIVCYLGSVTFGVAAVLVAFYYFHFTVSVEEERLASIYGEQFREYVARVPRVFPDFRLLDTSESLTVTTCGMRSELIRMLRWMWIPAGCYLLNVARHQAWWPTFVDFP